MDLMDLTPGELRHAQRKVGLKAGILGVLDDTSHEGWLDAVIGLAWVIQRRDDPGITVEAVADQPISTLTGLLGLDAEADVDQIGSDLAGAAGERGPAA